MYTYVEHYNNIIVWYQEYATRCNYEYVPRDFPLWRSTVMNNYVLIWKIWKQELRILPYTSVFTDKKRLCHQFSRYDAWSFVKGFFHYELTLSSRLSNHGIKVSVFCVSNASAEICPITNQMLFCLHDVFYNHRLWVWRSTKLPNLDLEKRMLLSILAD